MTLWAKFLVCPGWDAKCKGGTGPWREMKVEGRRGMLGGLSFADRHVELRYPPAAVLFEPDNACDVSAIFTDCRPAGHLAVPKGQIPITPSKATFNILQKEGSRTPITRRQYAITGASHSLMSSLKVKRSKPSSTFENHPHRENLPFLRLRRAVARPRQGLDPTSIRF